jgi:energy-coupling factor transporter ATP-binding protein EcfA2
MTKKAVYFLTGSSASGKTTLLKGVVESVYPELNAHHLDELGVPTLEEMNAQFGGPAQWQAYAVRRWIERVSRSDAAGLMVLDGQARPGVILDAAQETGLSAVHITLVDCSHAERRKRLLENRKQPDLDHLDMYAWAAYLRGQADALKLEVLDTTHRRPEDSINDLAGSIGRFAEAVGIRLAALRAP